jgi:hypothetical protein
VLSECPTGAELDTALGECVCGAGFDTLVRVDKFSGLECALPCPVNAWRADGRVCQCEAGFEDIDSADGVLGCVAECPARSKRGGDGQCVCDTGLEFVAGDGGEQVCVAECPMHAERGSDKECQCAGAASRATNYIRPVLRESCVPPTTSLKPPIMR